MERPNANGKLSFLLNMGAHPDIELTRIQTLWYAHLRVCMLDSRSLDNFLDLQNIHRLL